MIIDILTFILLNGCARDPGHDEGEARAQQRIRIARNIAREGKFNYDKEQGLLQDAYGSRRSAAYSKYNSDSDSDSNEKRRRRRKKERQRRRRNRYSSKHYHERGYKRKHRHHSHSPRRRRPRHHSHSPGRKRDDGHHHH